MQSAPIPINETERLEKLWELGIPDTSYEDRFDRVTCFAKRLFWVPIVLISLVDASRQLFKSCTGLDMHETSREISFCGLAILADSLPQVIDALNDPHFCDNPLLLGDPNIRFYTGQPLKVSSDAKVGAICLINRVPREFTEEEDRKILRDLTEMIEKELAAIQMATLDELTNLTNRRGLLALSKNTLNIIQRLNLPAMAFVLDLDGFKKISDIFGRNEGDRALRVFASVLLETFRDVDVVSRLGGNEFVALMENCPEAAAENVIARLTSVTEANIDQRAKDHQIRFSVGRVHYDSERHKTINVMISDADMAMYQAKQARKMSISAA